MDKLKENGDEMEDENLSDFDYNLKSDSESEKGQEEDKSE